MERFILDSNDWMFRNVIHHVDGDHNNDTDSNRIEITNYVHTIVHCFRELGRELTIDEINDLSFINLMPVVNIACSYVFDTEGITYDDSKKHLDKQGIWRNRNRISRELLYDAEPVEHEKCFWINKKNVERITQGTRKWIVAYCWLEGNYIKAREISLEELEAETLTKARKLKELLFWQYEIEKKKRFYVF